MYHLFLLAVTEAAAVDAVEVEEEAVEDVVVVRMRTSGSP